MLDRLGVISNNFERYGYQYISYNNILKRNNIDTNSKDYISLNAIDKMKYQVNIISTVCNIQPNIVLKYIFDLTTIDMLVLNQDRHFRNFGVFWNNKKGIYEIAPIFDNGMGLFENDNMFDSLDKLSDCMRYSYIAPYGEDHFELLNMLKRTSAYKNYLNSLNIKKLNINKNLFIHPVSYEYFCKIKGNMEV